MTDDLQLLTAADPAPSTRWPDGALDHAAERHLRSLVSGEHRPAPVTTRRAVRRTLLGTAVTGLAATLVVVAGGGPGTPAPPPAVLVQPVAAPAPLAVDPEAPVPSLAELAAVAAQRAAGSPPSVVRGSHVRTWYLGFAAEGEGFPAVVLPEEQLSVPGADGGLVVTSIAADPQQPTQVRLDPGAGPPADAEVVDVSAAQLATDPVAAVPPPADPAALAGYLTAVWTPGDTDLPGLLHALESVLLRWTPGPAESAAITGWLAQQPGLVTLGAVTDRLGRPGVAYALDIQRLSAVETRQTLVLDAGTGAVLSSELSFLGDTGEFDVDPYAVMSYVAYGVG